MRHWLLLLMLLALPSAAPLSCSVPSSTLPFPSSSPTTPIPYREQRGDGSTGGGGKAMPSSFARKQQQQHQQQQQPPPDSGNPPSDLSSLRRPAVGAPMPLGRPPWLTVKAPSPLESPSYKSLSSSLSSSSLKTVCEEARCPNQSECWSVGTATVMLLGDTCTRGCSFCAVKTSRSPPPPDASEPARVAMQIADWGLKYVVITVVDRDDLPDGGAAHIAETVRLCKSFSPGLLVEVLVGDWWGKGLGPDGPIDKVLASGLDVYAHNVETVERLQPYVRDGRAGYRQSLATLKCAKDIRPQVLTKSSLMLGLGESRDEVLKTMEDLRREGVDVVTFGQYLKPMEGKLSVVEYVHPDEFDFLRVKGEEMGFKYVASGPLVRSSYRAGEYFMENMIKANKASDLAKETARL